MSPARSGGRPASAHARPAPTFFVVGAGRVGLGFALALRARGWRLAGVWTRSAAGRRRARRLLGASAVASTRGRAGPRDPSRVPASVLPASISGADLVLVAVTDAVVPEIGRLLAAAPLRPGVVVAHTAGALPSSALGLPRRAGVHAGSLHPVVACASPLQASRSLVGATFAVEGDPTARRVLRRVVRSLRGRALAVAAANKPRYHAALVLASNLVVALVHLATTEAAAAGLRDAAAVAELTAGAVALVRSLGAREALTGPMVRGDAATVAAHLASLRGDTRRIYQLLSRVALELARERTLSSSSARALARVLRDT